MSKNLNQVKIETEVDYGRLVIISDIHYGNKNHDTKRFKYFMDSFYKDKDIYILGNGDFIEGATKHSVGYYDQIETIDKQVDYIVKKFKPFVDENRFIGFIRGNHEMRSLKDGGVNIAERMCNELEIKYLGDGAFLNFLVKKRNHKRGRNYGGYVTHGSSGARTRMGKMRVCEQLSYWVEADLYAYGHVHSLDSSKGFKYIVKPNSITEKEPVFILTGHYLEYLGSYAQQKNYRPSGPAGSPKIKLHHKIKRISVSL